MGAGGVGSSGETRAGWRSWGLGTFFFFLPWDGSAYTEAWRCWRGRGGGWVCVAEAGSVDWTGSREMRLV